MAENFSLNSAQISGLGLAIVGRLEEKIFASAFAFMVSIALVKAGLEFLEEVKE